MIIENKIDFINSRCILSDNPTLFIKIVQNITKKFNVYVGSMEGFDESNRNFKIYLCGNSVHLDIYYDYEYDIISYSIKGSDIYVEKINNYLKMLFNINYLADDMVEDVFGNKFKVLEDFEVKLTRNGLLCLSDNKIKLTNINTGENSELVYYDVLRDI